MKLSNPLKLAQLVGRNDAVGIEQLCKTMLDADSTDVMALMILTETYWHNDRSVEALQFALKVLAVDAQNFKALSIAAMQFAEQNESAHAYEYAKRLIDAPPVQQPPVATVRAILWPLKWLPKITKLRDSFGAEVDEEIAVTDAQRGWAIAYVRWVESGGAETPPVQQAT